MNEDNIIAAILATSHDSPEVAFNRYNQLQELLARRHDEDMPEVSKKLVNRVKAMRDARHG